jgi:EAL domain-containing protein (putative c-di-GMP-specific phosphodiesterase class I)/DNA-binding NarL/FixJ family response regulator
MMLSSRILVIEDETPIRGLIKDILASENYEVIEAENGKRGLAEVARKRPDLILCDVMMPDIDGYEVLQQLQQNPVTRAIPFLFLTARATREETRRGMNAGADDYIAKPFDEDELLEAIDTRLKKRAALRESHRSVEVATRKVRRSLVVPSGVTSSVREKASFCPLEEELRAALERERLVLYYQPQISIADRQITGAEVLVRWPHPERGFIPPSEFIPLAERSDLIDRLGDWVLRSACQQFQTWRSNGLYLPRLSVNLSARQFAGDRFQRQLTGVLETTEMPPGSLELELTEGTLIKNLSVAARRFNVLRELGVTIAIDDFGTGYSSLSYLHQLSFDTLKIDRVFVREIDKNPKNAAIVLALIAMARQLRLSVIAEGVETEAEMAFLQAHNCDEIQGFLFSPAVPASVFEELLQKFSFDRVEWG